jgi:hypothetical protein
MCETVGAISRTSPRHVAQRERAAMDRTDVRRIFSQISAKEKYSNDEKKIILVQSFVRRWLAIRNYKELGKRQEALLTAAHHLFCFFFFSVRFSKFRDDILKDLLQTESAYLSQLSSNTKFLKVSEGVCMLETQLTRFKKFNRRSFEWLKNKNWSS